MHLLNPCSPWPLKFNAPLWKTGVGEEWALPVRKKTGHSSVGGCRGLPPAGKDRVVGIRAGKDTGRGL